jgi:nucleotide-binding universal stress UspA family protein
MRNILLPLDGSRFSEYALPVALDMARRSGARLHIVQVHEPPVPGAYPESLVMLDERMDEALRSQEEEYLGGVAQRCQERAGILPATELLEGPVSTTLSAYAAETGIDQIIMTTHGRGGISRAWVGSVADSLVRRTAVPVLLLRPKDEALDWSRHVAPRHVLIPLDGSALSEAAIEPALALGAFGGARYTLLRIVLPIPFVAAPTMTVPIFDESGAVQSRADADVYLEEVAARLRKRGVDVNVEAIVHSIPALGILDYAATRGIEVIAMATRGRGGWSRVALGSVADKVMRGSNLPTLLYRPHATDAAQPLQPAAAAAQTQQSPEEPWLVP